MHFFKKFMVETTRRHLPSKHWCTYLNVGYIFLPKWPHCFLYFHIQSCILYLHFQIIQYQTVRYDTLPLSPISRNRLSEYARVFFSCGTAFDAVGGRSFLCLRFVCFFHNTHADARSFAVMNRINKKELPVVLQKEPFSQTKLLRNTHHFLHHKVQAQPFSHNLFSPHEGPPPR